jgi:hypothetical protein
MSGRAAAASPRAAQDRTNLNTADFLAIFDLGCIMINASLLRGPEPEQTLPGSAPDAGWLLAFWSDRNDIQAKHRTNPNAAEILRFSDMARLTKPRLCLRPAA